MLEARRPTVGEAATKPASTEEFAPVLEGASGALFGDPSEISKAAAEEAEEEEEEEKEEGEEGEEEKRKEEEDMCVEEEEEEKEEGEEGEEEKRKEEEDMCVEGKRSRPSRRSLDLSSSCTPNFNLFPNAA
eukprot:CAMPEP_0179954296 /NCGR_PEP_ID=MMETSP0983-20121128/25412_1 /TAXON_ID=483367 /ORGANISM="non described non described, Strain CCMP 2436" /LENGTH=130 /DNA_ID=CAMNT_0021865331 /DNA_START=154 /DNA_END=546 /DNA_ORIENTATION=+